MANENYDPALRNAAREALVILAVFATALLYTVSYCYLFGYDRPPGEIVTYWGIPDWVLWGILAPWLVCILFSTWFCLFFMAQDDLNEAAEEDQSASPAREGRSDVS